LFRFTLIRCERLFAVKYKRSNFDLLFSQLFRILLVENIKTQTNLKNLKISYEKKRPHLNQPTEGVLEREDEGKSLHPQANLN
jgi:hypothetical protein